MVLRNLVLQDFLKTGSKSYKLEVTFAIHPITAPQAALLFIIAAVAEKSKKIYRFARILLIYEKIHHLKDA